MSGNCSTIDEMKVIGDGTRKNSRGNEISVFLLHFYIHVAYMFSSPRTICPVPPLFLSQIDAKTSRFASHMNMEFTKIPKYFGIIHLCSPHYECLFNTHAHAYTHTHTHTQQHTDTRRTTTWHSILKALSHQTRQNKNRGKVYFPHDEDYLHCKFVG